MNHKATDNAQADPQITGPQASTPYTPGPYDFYRDSDGCDDYFHIVDQGQNRILASIQFWDDSLEDTERALANARLFASAPELLESLKVLLEVVGDLPSAILPAEFFAAEYKATLTVAQAERQ